MKSPLSSVAKKLAAAHRRADKKTTTIKFFPNSSDNVIQLLEVSMAAPTTGEILPFRFPADVEHGVDYPSVVVLVSPEEWERVESGSLTLPIGWNLAEAVAL